jgi:hypothetical protein
MSEHFFQIKVGCSVLLNSISIIYGFLHSSLLYQGFHQLIRCLYDFIRSTILLDQEATHLIRVGVGRNKLIFEHFLFVSLQ